VLAQSCSFFAKEMGVFSLLLPGGTLGSLSRFLVRK